MPSAGIQHHILINEAMLIYTAEDLDHTDHQVAHNSHIWARDMNCSEDME